MKYSEDELRKWLKNETINKTKVYYSIAKKDGKTLSFFSNDRLLIYDDIRRIIFYVNETKNTPFVKEVPNPKNNLSMRLDTCSFANPESTTSIQVRNTDKNDKGELQTIQWLFTFDNKALLGQWMNMLEKEKNKLVEEKTGEKGAGFIHDTLLEAVHQKPVEQQDQTILKPEEMIRVYSPPQDQSNIKNSRQSDPRNANIQNTNSMLLGVSQSNMREANKREEPPNEKWRQSEVKPVNQSVRESSIRPTPVTNTSGIKPAPANNTSGVRGTSIYAKQVSNVYAKEPQNVYTKEPSNVYAKEPSNVYAKEPSNVYAKEETRQSRQQPNDVLAGNSAIRGETESRYTANYNNPRQSQLGRSDMDRQYEKNNNNGTDWNHIFFKEPNEATIFDFEKAALNEVKALWSTDSANLDEPRRIYEQKGLRIIMTNCFSKEAKILKREFRNYHFILQSCKNKFIVGVPLCSLIEWQGVVVLVKAPLSSEAVQIKAPKGVVEIRQLERYTRVSNNILEKAIIWDLTEVYGSNGDQRTLYLDGLFQYLPIHLEEQLLGSSLRPEFLLDSVNQIIPGGDSKNVGRSEQKQVIVACGGLEGCMRQLAQFLTNQEALWVDAIELKQLLHTYGVNFKLIHRVYEGVQNKQVRRYIQSVMVAKVAKDHIYETFIAVRKSSKNGVEIESLVQEFLRILMEGNNMNSSELWKELTLKFKKQYGTPIVNSEIIPGFFLNSLIKLLRIRVDMTKFAKGKKIFKQQGILSPGFVMGIDPKVKSYYRYTTDFVEKIKYAGRQEKKSKDIFDEIVDSLELKSKSLPEEYQLNNNFQPIYQYLTYFSCPPEFDSSSQLKNTPIYAQVLNEPPTSFSLRITKSYIEWAIKKEKNEDFKKTIEQALRWSDFWLEDGHTYQTDLLQLLADFYSSQGNNEECINFMKESLSKTIRTCGSQSKRTGNKYYELGERQLRAGRKKDAQSSFMKAKANMLANKNTSIKYPLLLMRLASLHLNSGHIEGAIEGSLESIRQFDDYDKSSGSPSMTEGYRIKTFEVLARSYEISSRKAELKDMALICSRKFNKASMEWTFQQMIRICLAATIFYHSAERCQVFLGLCSKLQKDEEALDSAVALKQLMKLSDSLVVMEKFMVRFDTVERVASEGSSKKGLNQESRDFLMITKRLIAVVGDDYIEGLVQQKQYE